jgi:hypothetical protein
MRNFQVYAQQLLRIEPLYCAYSARRRIGALYGKRPGSTPRPPPDKPRPEPACFARRNSAACLRHTLCAGVMPLLGGTVMRPSGLYEALVGAIRQLLAASAPSGWGLAAGASSVPSPATKRLRPPHRWNRIGMIDGYFRSDHRDGVPLRAACPGGFSLIGLECGWRRSPRTFRLRT